MRKIIDQQFSRIDTVLPPARRPHVALRIWRTNGGRYAASVSAAGGAVGGTGDSPEKALGTAVTSYIALERRRP